MNRYKKINSLLFLCFLTCSFSLFAQGTMDAFKFSRNELSGSARFMGMAGAFGALGGDASAFSLNPAGLGIYRTNEVCFTPSLTFYDTQARRNNLSKEGNGVNFELKNLGIVIHFMDDDIFENSNFNFGFSINQIANFDRNIISSGSGLKTSITDYLAYKTNSTNNFSGEGYNSLIANNAYSNGVSWMSALGAGAGMIKEDADINDFYQSTLPGGALVDNRLTMRERGAINECNFTVASSVKDFLYWGVGVGVCDLEYETETDYTETWRGGDLYLKNFLQTTGKGWNLKLGVILRPVSFMRLGIAYHTPTWYHLTDYGYADGGLDNSDKTPEFEFDYKYRTPGKLLLDYSLIIDRFAILSVGYDYVDYSDMKLGSRNLSNQFDATNEYIKSDFKGSETFRVGAEIKPDPAYSIRAGWSKTTSGVMNEVANNLVEVETGGTLPHYSFRQTTENITFGLGYRYNAWFFDFAYVYRIEKGQLSDFSNYFVVEDDPANYNPRLAAGVAPPYGLSFDQNEVGNNLNENSGSNLKTFENQFVFSLGFKF